VIVAPDGTLIGKPIRSGEGVVIADLDFTLIDKRKQLMDSRGHARITESPDRPHLHRARSRTGCAPAVSR
jgi:predicted amidohydrolase